MSEPSGMPEYPAMRHHPSCRPAHDLSLIWHCSQCGATASGEAVRERIAELERERDAAQAAALKEGIRAGAAERALAEARAKTIEECAKEVESHWNDNLTMVNQHAQSERSAACIRALAAKGEG
jgi:hypothetical protein